MKKISLLAAASLFFLFATVLTFSACDEEELSPDGALNYLLGWIGAEDENLDELEQDINLDETIDDGSLPSSVDLSAKFPPIGNQGQYGTCVAWSLGYNLRTFLHGVDNGLSSSQLATSSNQFSPKDLFWAISNANKGEDCNGTGFESAFDIMVSRGVATLSKVPYTGLGDCSSSPESEWTGEANSYKIENYRKISYTNINEIKDYLNDGRAVAIGAKLGDNFMSWNSSNIISSDTYLDPGMQHAYHAMALCGYDDNKGPNGAFRVVNSWGTNWGDNGYIWVDYNFFVNEFCFCAFVAKSLNSNYSTPGSSSSTYDLVGWALADEYDSYDYGSGPSLLNRKCSYNVYNVGQSAITASNKWNIVYLYYNAYDANDYGIVLYDYYTNEYGSYGQDGNLADVTGATLYGASGNWWNYIDVPAGWSVADALYDPSGSDPGNYFQFTYSMPTSIPDPSNPGSNKAFTGSYYLVMIADGFDAIAEHDEANNYLYFAQENGDPFQIINGVIQDGAVAKKKIANFSKKPSLYADSPFPTVRTESNVNSYSTAEITQMLIKHKESGRLQAKVDAFLAANPGKGNRVKVGRK
ncbi:MAG: C1 family peptidase [Bacteroidales bacterium]|nr:C1 family peptidase [Bacteroidales bacterium]